MTTIVTIKTHDHPADVSTFPCDENREPIAGATWSEPERVEAHSEHTVCLHRNIDVLVRELEA